ncbi:MAG: GTPase Era [Bacteroidota bacterium]
MSSHKAGFVTIIGKPNVGKSTLMNALVGERLSIITSKAQTTRHRIVGILSGEDFQVIYSDTPGVLEPQYELHERMMKFVKSSLEDADLVLFITDLYEKYDEGEELVKLMNRINTPILFLLNKVDQAKGSQAEDKLSYLKELFNVEEHLMISALEGEGIDELLQIIKEKLPEHPAYFSKDELTDKPEKFFASEIIREKIFLNYKKEVPYSTEVEISEFKESGEIIRIRAELFVERDSQKGIIIGKGGEALKKVGIEAREDLEKFFQKKVYLETFVKVEKDWRRKEKSLKKFGYKDK